ncbi:hypothetical protein M4D79_12090 [Mycolicibacterium novocastrense]|nr:hypothetical protein M4D79_12090 [Mycolicibacterium novocastrense]
MENITNQQVGARIAEVRGAMKMTQAELASELTVRLGREIRPLTVTRLEGGKRPIGVDELVAAAEALHVKPEHLLHDGSLPIGSAIIIEAYQRLLRAANQLENAVRQYDSAQHHLQEVLEEDGGDKWLKRLPGFTQVFVKAARDWTAEFIVANARNEEVADDGAEA